MRLLSACLLLLNTMFSFAADTLIMNVNARTNSVLVTLPANPTTGFQWTVKSFDKKLLQLTDSQFLASHTHLMGAGGQMTYRFTKIKGVTYPKSTTLLFRYARAWEHNGGMIKRVIVHFQTS